MHFNSRLQLVQENEIAAMVNSGVFRISQRGPILPFPPLPPPFPSLPFPLSPLPSLPLPSLPLPLEVGPLIAARGSWGAL